MPIRPVELLRFAKTLDRRDEAARRAAISRAYYCAYHAALPVAEKLPPAAGYDVPNRIPHRQIADRLKDWKIPAGWSKASKRAGNPAMVAKQYRAALTRRKRADYELDGVIPPVDVEIQLKRVADINAFMTRLKAALPAEFPARHKVDA
jgi:hypothetical protein